MLRVPKRSQAVLITIGVALLASGLIFGLKKGNIKILADTTPQSAHGIIYDQKGMTAAGVKVYQSAKPTEFVTSNSSGEYNLPNLPTGDVTLVFEKYGTNFPLGYSDVTSSYWAYREIASVNHAKVMQGFTSNNTYRPENTLKRSEMAVTLARAIALANGLVDSTGLPNVPAGPASPSFSDVPTSYWAYKEIEYIKSQGVTSGYTENNTFRPELSVSRDQLAVFICRAIRLPLLGETTGQKFTDISSGSFGNKEIMTMVYMGLISGFPEPDGTFTFRPKMEITRAQTAVFIARAFKNIALTDGGYTPKKISLRLDQNTVAECNVYLAESGKFGVVSGQAKDSAGKVISGAKVVLGLGPEIDDSYAGTTDSNGNFQLYNIPEGTYSYSVFKPDTNDLYGTGMWENMVNVRAGKATQLELFNLQ